jgi:hypothetical protein
MSRGLNAVLDDRRAAVGRRRTRRSDRTDVEHADESLALASLSLVIDVAA